MKTCPFGYGGGAFCRILVAARETQDNAEYNISCWPEHKADPPQCPVMRRFLVPERDLCVADAMAAREPKEGE